MKRVAAARCQCSSPGSKKTRSPGHFDQTTAGAVEYGPLWHR